MAALGSKMDGAVENICVLSEWVQLLHCLPDSEKRTSLLLMQTFYNKNVPGWHTGTIKVRFYSLNQLRHLKGQSNTGQAHIWEIRFELICILHLELH